MDSELEQAMAEKMLMLAQALDRAQAGVATEGDWWMIRAECGIPSPIVKLETRSEKWVLQ